MEAALAADPELEADLEPLVDGLDPETRVLLMRCFAARLEQVRRPQSALLPALADVMRSALAEGSAHEPESDSDEE